MKRGTTRNRKMKALARRLKIELYAAVGLMEMLWEYAADVHPRGDIGTAPDEDIAEAVAWPTRRAAALIEGLVSERWLDADPISRLIVHDWPEHCEYEVCRRLINSGKDFMPQYGTSVKLRARPADKRGGSVNSRVESELLRASREVKAIGLGSGEVLVSELPSGLQNGNLDPWLGTGFADGEDFEAWYKRLYAAHPTKGDYQLGQDYLREHFVVKRTFTRGRFEELYSDHRRSRAWTRNGGERIPKLSTFCKDDGCAYGPTEIPIENNNSRSIMDGV